MTVALVRLGKSVDTSIQERVEALDWECENADTRYLTHGLHRYSGKFIPQIARQVISLLTTPGDLVLDPLCGSGTTLLEAYISGRRSIGIDMNPLATLLARTKCSPISRTRLDGLIEVMEEVVADIRECKGEGWLFSLAGNSAINDDPYTGMGMLYEYLYAGGASSEARTRNLVFHFPNITIAMWREASRTGGKAIRLYSKVADGILFRDGFLMSNQLLPAA